MSTCKTTRRPFVLMWSELDKWAHTSGLLRFGTLPTGWRLIAVSQFASQIEHRERVEPDTEYRMAGVRWYGKGVFHRETVKGADQSSTYLTPLVPRAFIYNRLFAWKESFAVVPQRNSSLFVSNEFPQFLIDKAYALPEYLYLLFTTTKIINAVNAASIGSSAKSRNRFKEDDFLNFKVPIPPLSVQQKTVAHWEIADDSCQKLKDLRDETKKITFNEFRESLGLSTSITTTRPCTFVTQWSNIGRWGFEQAWLNRSKRSDFIYSTMPLRMICKSGSGGTPSRKDESNYGGDILWVKSGEVVNDIIIDTEEKISSEGLASSSAKLYPQGSLIIAMYGQGATRGRTAKLGVEAATNQACLVITDIDELLNLDFLWYYLMVSYDDMRGLASGNNQPNLSADLIGGFPVPIPPMKTQVELVASFKDGLERVSQLESQETALRKQVVAEIEQIILGTKQVEDITGGS